MLEDPIVHCVQILDIERREGQRAVEFLRKKTLPSVIAHEHHPFACDGIYTFKNEKKKIRKSRLVIP